ncbi:hypothetical protein P20495_2049 [Pseudoalteromonas sp. BSi20495]|nr:hypothetical protein P20495_2049 [Pseudoalteromonas sp. BSi20495]
MKINCKPLLYSFTSKYQLHFNDVILILSKGKNTLSLET